MTTMDRQTVTPCNQLDPTPQELALLRAAVDAEQAALIAEVVKERQPLREPALDLLEDDHRKAKALAYCESYRRRKAREKARYARIKAAKQRTPARAGVSQCPATARTRGGRGMRRAA